MALTTEERNRLLEQGQVVSDAPEFERQMRASGILTGDLLKTQPDLSASLTYQNPNADMFAVSSLNAEVPQLQPTVPETKADVLSEQLQRINERLTGQSAFRAQKESELDVAGLQKTQTDLSSRLKQLQGEALAIPLQLQQEATGRGITTGGLAPLQAGRLRVNAIQALGIASLLQASQGNLTNAQGLVDRAVQQQFAPLEEEKQVLISNLDLILKSPAYSFAEKNRATRQKALEEDRSAKITKQKEDVTAGQAMAAAAVKNYADNQEVLFAAQQVLKLDPLSPDYLSRAFGLVGKYQRDPQAIQRAILENRKTEEEIAKLRAGEAQKTVQGGEAQKIMQGGEAQLYSGLSASTATAVRSRVSKFASEPTIQNFATIQEGRNFSQAISDTTKNPADDQALIYSLAKALDPGSVVREGEYATAQKYAQSWVKAYGKGITQALLGTGFLSQNARENIKKTIEQKYQASKRSYDSLLGQYKTGINNLTGRSDGSKFLTDYTVGQKDTTQLTGPDGKLYDIPNNKVAAFKAAGGH